MKNMKIILTIVLAVLILSPISSFAAFSGNNNFTYTGTTADVVTLMWNAPVGYQTGDVFEIQLKNKERNTVVNIPETTALTKTFKCPKTGHWTVYIRSKRLVGSTWEFSTWVNSTDVTVATVDGQPRAWWLFTWVAGTGPIQ